MKPAVVLGIDPGTASCGYGIITYDSEAVEALGHGCIRTNADQDRGERLKIIYDKVNELIEMFSPDHIVMERVFFYKGAGRNFSTAMNVGEAVGVIKLCAAQHGIPTFDYAPTRIKQVLTGHGKADKKEVEFMVNELLDLDIKISSSHASDALACALTHKFQMESGDE